MATRILARLWKSLYFRVFLSLWFAAGLTLTTGYLLNWFLIADFARASTQESKVLMLSAASVLDQRGEAGLVEWLSELPDTRWGSPVLVFDAAGRELLDRPTPPTLTYALDHADAGAARESPLAILPAQPMPVLIGRDGRRYAIFIRALHQPSVPPFRMQPLRNKLYVYGFAVLLTLFASWLLTRSIVRPVRAIGRSVRALSGGALETRVADALSAREDEIGSLAREFDSMAMRLQKMIQAREQLLRDVSHELRSPLARMRVALGLAKQSDADQTIAVERLETEVSRLDRLIGQVLNLARMDASAVPLKTERIDLVEIVDAIVRDAAFEGQARHISVEWDCDQPTVLLAGRAVWISSAVENVVRNALHFSEAGSGIAVRMRATAHGVSVEVSDRGPGVSPDELTRIFEPFYRAQSSRSRERDGDGIGLAIVARVMQLHGGTATAENRSGGGLVIRLMFPANLADKSISGGASRT